MYYRSRVTDQLTKKEMERARRAFIGLLQRRGYSWRFIEENGEELLAIAHTEFARALDKGVDVEEPVAWTVNCAWRRTQNLHTAEGRRPPSVSTENLLELVDEGAPDPEEIVEEAERARKIREAVAELNEAQRQVIALTYFEGMSVREAARRLGWHASKAQYAHKTAIKSLFEHLGVTSSDQLTVEIGLAAFLTFGAREGLHSLPAGIEAVLERAGHGATGAWGRLQEAARRLGPGGSEEAAGAIASSGAGRAAGVCAAGLAAVCLGAAGGVINVGLGGGHDAAHPVAPARGQTARADHGLKAGEPAAGPATTPSAPSAAGVAAGGSGQGSTGTGGEASSKSKRTPAAGIPQTRRQWRGTDRALVAAEAESGEATSGSAASSTASSAQAESGTSAASATEKQAAQSEFDAFVKSR